MNKAALQFLKREFEVEFFIFDVTQAKTTKTTKPKKNAANSKKKAMK